MMFTIHNPAEMDALPDFSIVGLRMTGEDMDNYYFATQKEDGVWFPIGFPAGVEAEELPDDAFPAVLLWRP